MTEVTPYRIAVSDEQLDDLRTRLRMTRWPERETVSDWSQGIPSDYMKQVCEHWLTSYDWRSVESRLNAFPQVRTVVDGLGFTSSTPDRQSQTRCHW